MPVVTNVEDLRQLAKKRVARAIFDYVDRGSYDEATLRANRADLEALTLRHPLAQRQSLEVGAVGAQRGLVVGAAVDVVEDRSCDAPLRELAQVLDVGHHRHGAAFYNARKSWLPPGTR